MTVVLPNPYSPYADADPLYRHIFPSVLPSLFGEPAPGALAETGCERMAVVPDEPLQFADDPDAVPPAGLCPACITAMHGGQLAPATVSECQRCESTTRHVGLCALCRQEKHTDWWQASNTYARPFRLVLPGKRTLDGAVFPGGQAVVIDDPEDALASAAPSFEQLLTGYHRAEVMFAEEIVPVALARAQHAVGLYAETAIALEDARRANAELTHDAERFKEDHLGACGTIAEMHAAATGRTGLGPIRGVVEDVADVRERADRLGRVLVAIENLCREHDHGHEHACPDDVRRVVTEALNGPSTPVVTGPHHFGRSWSGHAIEDACPCTKASCGLVSEPSAECTEHSGTKSTRQSHPADACPGDTT